MGKGIPPIRLLQASASAGRISTWHGMTIRLETMKYSSGNQPTEAPHGKACRISRTTAALPKTRKSSTTQDGGLNWEGSRRLTWTSGQSFSPFIFTDSNNHIHTVWYDGTPGNNEVYYRRSTDGGTSWAGVKRLTWSDADSWYPVGVADLNQTIHIVWEDTPISEYDLEIYYKRGIQ